MDIVRHLIETVEFNVVVEGQSLDSRIYDEFGLAVVNLERLMRALVSTAALQVHVADPNSLMGSFETIWNRICSA